MKHGTRTRILVGSAALSLALAFAFTGTLPQTADAQRRLRAQLYLTQASVPRDLSESGLLRWARSHNTKVLNETTAEEIPQRHWPANLIIAFSAAPDDLEFHALFYDVEDGPRNLVDDMTIYVGDPDQETYVQRLNLERPRFRPNRRTEMVVTVHHAEVGTLRFEIRGTEPIRDGMVDFGDGSTEEDE
jgi:hypothetical protein